MLFFLSPLRCCYKNMLLLRMVPNIIYCLKYFNNASDYGIEPDTFIGLKRKPLGKQHLMEFEEK